MRMCASQIACYALATVASLFMSNAATSDPITYTITGEVIAPGDELPLTIGSRYNLTIDTDTNAPPIWSDTTVATYFSSGYELNFPSISYSYSAQFSPNNNNRISVINNRPEIGNQDAIWIVGGGNGTLSNSYIGPNQLNSFFVQLQDSSQSALSSLQLPTAPLSPDQFDTAYFTLYYLPASPADPNGPTNFALGGSIDSFAVISSPSATFISKAIDVSKVGLDIVAKEALTKFASANLCAALTAGPTAGGGAAACYTLFGISTMLSLATNGIELWQIVNDPPDNDYLSVFLPQDYFFELPDSGGELSPEFMELANNAIDRQAELYALTQAWRITLERYNGAVVAGDMDAAALQLAALENYILLASAAATSAQTAITAIIGPLEALLGPLEVAEADILAYQAFLGQNGFDSDALQVLQSLGLSEDQINDILNSLLAVDSAQAQTDISQALGDLADSYGELATLTVCVGKSCLIHQQAVSTPQSPFLLEFEYMFLTDMGWLDIYIDSLLLDTLRAPYGLMDDYGFYSFSVSDSRFYGLSGATLSFIFGGQAASEMLVRNVALEVDIPEPPSVLIFFLGIIGLWLLGCKRIVSNLTFKYSEFRKMTIGTYTQTPIDPQCHHQRSERAPEFYF